MQHIARGLQAGQIIRLHLGQVYINVGPVVFGEHMCPDPQARKQLQEADGRIQVAMLLGLGGEHCTQGMGVVGPLPGIELSSSIPLVETLFIGQYLVPHS